METMKIALPESMKSFVQSRVTEGGYGDVSEYVRALIRADQERQVEAKIDALLVEGINSGAPVEATPEFWDAKKRVLSARHSENRAT